MRFENMKIGKRIYNIHVIPGGIGFDSKQINKAVMYKLYFTLWEKMHDLIRRNIYEPLRYR